MKRKLTQKEKLDKCKYCVGNIYLLTYERKERVGKHSTRTYISHNVKCGKCGLINGWYSSKKAARRAVNR